MQLIWGAADGVEEAAEVASLRVLRLVEVVAAVAAQIVRPAGETMLRMTSKEGMAMDGIGAEVAAGGTTVEVGGVVVGALTIPMIKKRERRRTISQTSQTLVPSAPAVRTLHLSRKAPPSRVRPTQMLPSNGKSARSNVTLLRHGKRERERKKT